MHSKSIMTTTPKNAIANDTQEYNVLETFPLSATHANLTSAVEPDEDYYTQEELSTPPCRTRTLTCPERPSKKNRLI